MNYHFRKNRKCSLYSLQMKEQMDSKPNTALVETHIDILSFSINQTEKNVMSEVSNNGGPCSLE